MTSDLTARLQAFRRDDSIQAAYELISALRAAGRAEEAVALLAATAERAMPPIWSAQLGICAHVLGQNRISIVLLERALAVLTEDEARMACMVDLAAAKFATGLYHQAHPIYRQLHERRWLAAQWRHLSGGADDYWWAPFADRLLVDQPVEGRRIMLVHDQGGFGDLFQLVRYVDELRREGAAQIHLSAQTEVADLVATKTGVVVTNGLPPLTDWDLVCPLFSLFARYQAHPYVPSWPRPYLSAPPSASPPPSLPASGRPKVGVIWRSASRARHEPYRSMPLSALAPVLDYGGVDWLSLQVDARAEDEAPLLARLGVVPLGDQLASFADTARLLERIDLLISIDSAPVHLAGALGRPVWALLCQAPDYRWCDDPRFTPWYPSARLFRQERLGDWSNVIAAVSDAVRRL
jgi:tetratricopeptide (TPR) repeat protein